MSLEAVFGPRMHLILHYIDAQRKQDRRNSIRAVLLRLRAEGVAHFEDAQIPKLVDLVSRALDQNRRAQ